MKEPKVSRWVFMLVALTGSFSVACGSDAKPTETATASVTEEVRRHRSCEALDVGTYTSAGQYFAVSSHLVTGGTEALLVDGQMFAADATAVVEKVRASGKKLKTVFLTHAHPDHYMGFAVIKAAFPGARFVTTAAVRADYEASAAGTLAYLRSTLGDAVASSVVTLDTADAADLAVDGAELRVLELEREGESKHGAALALDGKRALISGNLAYHGVHLFVGECQAEGWADNLDEARQMGFETVYPGHGGPADRSIFRVDKNYLKKAIYLLNRARAAGGSSADIAARAEKELTARFPEYGGGALLQFSIQQYYANCK